MLSVVIGTGVPRMLGTLLLSLLISSFAFKAEPPLDRALRTVGLAWLVQLGVALTLAPAAMLTLEGFGRVVLSAVFAAILSVAFWWSYKRRWTEDD